jgi:hypothetical protein
MMGALVELGGSVESLANDQPSEIGGSADLE